MRAQNPLELTADALNGGARALVSGVGVQADAQTCQLSKAWVSMRSLASVLAAVRIADRASQV